MPTAASRSSRCAPRSAGLATAPADAHDVYLRLHLLSSRLVRPRGCNLDSISGLLANVVWTNHGPCPARGLRGHPAAAAAPWPGHRARGGQVPPDGGLRAALRGAHLRRGPGPARRPPGGGPRSCMRASSTATPARWAVSMVEGRISASVVVGDGIRRGRRSVHHGHPVRRRQRDDLGRRALPDRRERRDRYLARRRLRGRRPACT